MWQPIETAPKDQFLLLCGPSGYTTIPFIFTTGRTCSDYHLGRWIGHANDDLTAWGFEPTHWATLPDPLGAQPSPSFADAYQGAMEEVAIWKRRALEAEDMNRKFIAEINGPAHMGEPAQPAQKAVAYLDIGAGGYTDIGTDLNDEQLASLPKGRHMLGIVGTYGVDGYVSTQPAPSAPDISDNMIEAIESRAEQSYRRHHSGIRGQQITPADALSWHIIHATRSVLVEAMEAKQ